ncbi:aminotransferase class I/II-fold pyridoxal phosphate-dependent enzyme [Pseudonocardia hispaniensis]|uniref:Aminotransferase class I/II-fold pyridoxal phosphate-dependent enzyme n=2 Tax=Pseudonocardia hispaniensis TaxID=904933 RepID=A0ABW1IXJ1_9PSEU
MPDLAYAGNRSLRDLERELGRIQTPKQSWDLTGADTHVFPPPEYAIKEMTRAATGGGVTYTPYRGDPGVREAVAANITAHLGMDLDPATELILTPGTQSGLFAALSALVDEHVTVVLPDPDYLLTERMVRYLRADVVRVSMDFSNSVAPTLDLDAVEAALHDGARVFVFSNPNNPSGGVYEPQMLVGLARLLVQYDAYAIADQLYCRLLYDDTRYAHLREMPGMAERTITLLGPSKTESLSGYRLGVAVAPPALIDAMEEVLCISAMRAPAYAQHVLTRWMDLDIELINKRVGEYQSLRDLAVEKLRSSSAFEVYVPQGTSYVFPKIIDPELTDQQVAAALRRAGVVINPGYQFGACGRGHIRICIAQGRQALSDAHDTIIDVVEGLSSRS